MIRKFHEAKENGHSEVMLWGSGSPMREFLHVDDLGEAVLFAVENVLEDSLYNIGTGVDLTIKNLAEKIQSLIGHKGSIVWDSSKPDGTPRKLLDVSKMSKEGWSYSKKLNTGIRETYEWFQSNAKSIRKVKIK